VSYAPSPAGFWKRYVAYFIDMVILTVVINIVMTAVMAALGAFAIGTEPDLAPYLAMLHRGEPVDPAELIATTGPWLLLVTAVTTALYVVLAGAYFVLTEAGPRQGSFGKQLVGIKVTDRDGQPVTRARALGRFAAASLSWLTLNVGHALAAWTRERRALHDYVAGTRVENADPAATAMPGWGWAIIALNAVVFLGIALAGVAAGVFLALQASGQTSI
jgi:uncharacterized RDD family membrane protein YckC